MVAGSWTTERRPLDLMHRFFESPIEYKNEFGLVHPILGK